MTENICKYVNFALKLKKMSAMKFKVPFLFHDLQRLNYYFSVCEGLSNLTDLFVVCV